MGTVGASSRAFGHAIVLCVCAAWGLTALAPWTLAEPAAHHAHIQGFAFSPSTLTVQAGDSVTWDNHDGAPHTATSDSGVAPAFNTGTLGNGQSKTIKFETSGRYPYHCAFHPGMTGVVVVEAAAPPPAQNQAPMITFASPPNGSRVRASVDVSGAVTDPDATDTLSATWRVDAGAPQALPLGPGGAFSLRWNATPVPNGEHTLTVTATDGRGASASRSLTLVVDNPPAPKADEVRVEILSPSANATVSGLVSVRVGANSTTGRALTVDVRADDGAWQRAQPHATEAGVWTLAWNTSALDDGDHALRARATDGTLSAQTPARLVTVRNAPAPQERDARVVITHPASGARVSGFVAVQGSAPAPEGRASLVEVRIDQGEWRAAQAQGTAWAFSWDATTVATGPHVIHARATAGGVVGDPVSVTVVVERAPQTGDATIPEGTQPTQAPGLTVPALVGAILILARAARRPRKARAPRGPS